MFFPSEDIWDTDELIFSLIGGYMMKEKLQIKFE